MITGVCSLIQYVQELREKVEFYLFIHAVLGIGLSSMIGMAASTDCRKMRLMSHGAYIKSVAGTDDLLGLLVSSSVVTNMSLELIEDSHTNRHMATLLSILAP
jgi:hypothetical protein